MKVFLAGATGAIGRRLVALLAVASQPGYPSWRDGFRHGLAERWPGATRNRAVTS